MNPNTKTAIGSPMINISAKTTPPVPTAEPFGSVAALRLVALTDKLVLLLMLKIDVALFTTATANWEARGITVLTIVVSGNITAVSKSPIMNAHIAATPDIISAKDTTGTFLTSSPSSPNFI